MAVYPSYNILLTSSRTADDGIDDEFSQSGTQHSRTFYSATYYNFIIQHALTITQYKALKATFDAGKRADYTLTYLSESPQVTYTVKFTGSPQIVSNIKGDLFLVEVPLRGTQD